MNNIEPSLVTRHASLVIALCAVAASAPVRAASDAVVVIGHAAPLTGQLANIGKDSENAARMAIEDVNARHLMIGGRPVTLRLDSQDDAADPRTGTQVAQKLVDDGVVAVVGNINSGVSIPASRIFSEAGVVQISPASTNPAYTQQGYKTTYRLVATDAMQGPALARYAMGSMHAKRIAVVDDSTAYGQGLAEQFAKSVTAGGGVIVAHEATNDKASDFRAILTKLKGLKPDAIMYGGSDATAGPLVKQAANLGVGARILAGDGACTDKMNALAGDAIRNLVCSEAGLPLARMPRGADFEKRYVERFKTPINAYAPFAYDAVYVIVDAMKRADSTDKAKILAAMPATKYDGVTGNISFDPHGDLTRAAITVYQFKNDKKIVADVIHD
ncbi:branched-chain amino acid ABC transporter substrate-binding protein [Caballeronia grimmiae]|jgi:branched-chain amino acid transport system substrate-binding protein|uniref:Branched-chain amino acid ABC transporter substrate-binding protein n=1 Tax=Caballeronia grimmiae TaxID=1071679 RepID=A0A069NRQ3_9BURK|nr:branched-chain amino acid ABC transporter substrate-binding protein [Caballeronia grimmiae]KDR31035.1 branched-chain amino acid ABC transporter substrate-binding protein [Caballeronia grimmiae]GGD94324.1 branched chain amino acid ABC transporter substrate-binding protein [Caballeronia grimmiae]